jgi:cytochrome P450
LDLLLKVHLENPSSLSLSDINDEVNTFMFEGHDTTSAAIEWACYCIARNPDVQKKIQNELNEELGLFSLFWLFMDSINDN